MPRTTGKITPDEIRAIRKSLGLTQVEAGELLGGGPRGFTKYEAGVVKPAASVVNLLRLLDANPRMIKTLAPQEASPMAGPETGPFAVSGEHIAVLTERMLAELLRRLLSAEAQEHGIPASAVQVSSRIHTPDGGEDGRIEWTGPPSRTPFLPGRLCTFQLKTGKIGPAAASSEILTRNGEVKSIVRSVVEAGGHYIMLCANPYVQQEIEARKARIRDAIRGVGLAVGDSQIYFLDADQIAGWVTRHAAVATWVRERTQPGLVGPFRSWSHWAGRSDHDDSPWIDDERLVALRGDLCKSLTEPRNVVRVVGLAGVGKTRLVLEALGPTDDDDLPQHSLSTLVLYAVESEVGAECLNETVQSLVDAGNRVIVVVDDCAPETHRSLSNMVLRQSSCLSLVTIDHEDATGTHDQKTIQVAEAPRAVTEAIIDRMPLQNHEDKGRLARFCEGFPKIAIRVGHAWVRSVPMARATDDDLINAFVLGRRPLDSAALLKSAELLATFGLVYREPSAASQLGEIAKLGRNLKEADFRYAVEGLRRRGIVRSRGRAIVLQPRTIAAGLAERQWQKWSPAEWDTVLVGDASPNLRVSAAVQLALLNTTDTALRVTKHVCRPDGPLDGFEQLSRTRHAEVLRILAGIEPAIVAERIERSLDDVPDLRRIAGDLRRQLVWALESIAFDAKTFKQGASLLLRLATAENESISNNATGVFKALFPVFLGGTAADGDTRLSLLEEVKDTSDAAKCVVMVEALTAGTETEYFMRFVGAEAPGSRPALESWRPVTEHAAFTYISDCVARLIRYSERTDEVGTVGRDRLAERLRPLVSCGFIDVVEIAVDKVLAAVDQWPRALEELGHFLQYDCPGTDPGLAKRVKVLVAKLEPKSVESLVRFLVTEMPWDYPCDERLDVEVQQQRQQDAVRELARDLAKRPAVLERLLPQLSQGDQRMAFYFGHAIGESSRAPSQWLDPLITSVSDAPEAERNYSLLSGFLVGIAESCPKEIAAFKERAARSRALAPALPQVCWHLHIKSSDIALVLRAFNDGLLHPFQLTLWRAGGVLARVPATAIGPLIDAMLVHSAEGFAVGVELMGMYAHGAPDKLDGFRSQIRTAAANATRWDLPKGHQVAPNHHFDEIMTWLLDKGRDDPDARAVALTLAGAIVDGDAHSPKGLIDPVVPKLLSGFPEIVWPFIGQAVVSSHLEARRLRLLLGNVYSFRQRQYPPLLSLPEDALFAWCHAHLDQGPNFAASVLPFLTSYEADATDCAIHPVMARLLDEFGDHDDMLRAVERNIACYSWSGSRTAYYALYQQPMSELLSHHRFRVRRWAQRMLRRLSAHIQDARNEDEEELGWSETH